MSLVLTVSSLAQIAHLKLEKDCYDVYVVCGFTGGNLAKSAREFTRRFSKKSTSKREKDFVFEALKRIQNYFSSRTSRGPIAVSRFYGIDEGRQTDSYQRVARFLGIVQ